MRRGEGQDRREDQEERGGQVHADDRRQGRAGRRQGGRQLRQRSEADRLQEGRLDLKRLIVGITGATGAVYGISLLRALKGIRGWESHLVLTDAGVLNVW